MTDKTGRRHAAAAQPSRVCRGFLRDGSRGDGIISETTATDVSRSPRMSVALLMAAILALSAMPSRAGTPTIREYGPGERTSTHPVVRELAPPKLPPAEGMSPFALSLFPAAELPPRNWDIVFLRVNLLVGRHRDVYGVDVGAIGNETTGEFVGIQSAGLYNRVGFSEGALQLAGVMNRSEGDFVGFQAAVAANITHGTMAGFQLGLVNRAARLDGLQIGLFNIAETGSGVQIGLWNSAQSLEGLQIGLGNCNSASTIPFFPVINFAF